MDFMLSRAPRVTAQWASAPGQHAVARFWRDMEMTLSTTGFVPDNRLMICLAPALPPESYTLDVTENQLTLCAADDLGAVYYPRTECEYSGGWYRLTAVGYVNSGRTIVRAGAEYTNNSAASGDIYLDDLLVKIAPEKTKKWDCSLTPRKLN